MNPHLGKMYFCPWMDDIEIKQDVKVVDECFQTYVLGIAMDLGYKHLSYNMQMKLVKSIIRKESYIAGFKKPIVAPKTCYIWWATLQNNISPNPQNAPYVLRSKRGKKS